MSYRWEPLEVGEESKRSRLRVPCQTNKANEWYFVFRCLCFIVWGHVTWKQPQRPSHIYQTITLRRFSYCLGNMGLWVFGLEITL